jgi:hypothetical protein
MKALQLLLLAATLALPWTTTLHSEGFVGSAALAADPPAPADAAPKVAGDAPKIDVTVNGGHEVWYTNPFLLTVGAIGVLVLLLVVALAARGNGTTIIKE